MQGSLLKDAGSHSNKNNMAIFFIGAVIRAVQHNIC